MKTALAWAPGTLAPLRGRRASSPRSSAMSPSPAGGESRPVGDDQDLASCQERFSPPDQTLFPGSPRARTDMGVASCVVVPVLCRFGGWPFPRGQLPAV